LEELKHLSEKYYFFLKGIQNSKCALEDCEETRDEEEKKKTTLERIPAPYPLMVIMSSTKNLRLPSIFENSIYLFYIYFLDNKGFSFPTSNWFPSISNSLLYLFYFYSHDIIGFKAKGQAISTLVLFCSL